MTHLFTDMDTGVTMGYDDSLVVSIVNGYVVLNQPNSVIYDPISKTETVVPGALIPCPPHMVPYVAVPPTLAQLQSAQIRTINAAAQAAIAQIISAYPDLEVATWPQQYADAVAYTANNSTVTPILTPIAVAAGSTVAALAPVVIAKASAYQTASGGIVGKRQLLTAQIEAITDPTPADPSAATIASIAAIVW